MNTRYYRLLTPLFVLMALLTAACSSDTATDDEQPLPEGMGRIRITICTPEANPDQTRAVNANPWEEPDHEWERLHTFRILIFDNTYKLVDIIEDTTPTMTASTPDPSYKQSATVESAALTAGTYYVYATANYADGFVKGNQYSEADIIDKTVRIGIDYSSTKYIPMSGKLASSVKVSTGTTDAGIITVWRMVSKLQFYFTNEASEDIQIMGIEVDPVNTNASDQGLVYLFSKDNLTSTANLAANGGVTLPSGVTTGSVSYEIPSSESPETLTPLLTLAAKNEANTDDEGTLFFYVNESDATFTTTQNQYSLRFKIKRGGTISELRYGVTTHYGDGSTGQDGFNVIRRNDWIHIPIHLTDWQIRIEPLAFVPIAGYPASTVSSDGLTATFSTGGMIALQPFIMKKNDPTWRDFGDPEVKLTSITWKNSDGVDIYGDGENEGDKKIVKTAFAYDPVTKSIIGELNQARVGSNAKTTFTVNVDLGKSPNPVYHYSFTFNVILQ